jgi:hypothetical protein
MGFSDSGRGHETYGVSLLRVSCGPKESQRQYGARVGNNLVTHPSNRERRLMPPFRRNKWHLLL